MTISTNFTIKLSFYFFCVYWKCSDICKYFCISIPVCNWFWWTSFFYSATAKSCCWAFVFIVPFKYFFLVEILVHRIRTDSGGSMVDILRWWLLVGTLVPSFLHLHFDHFGGDAFFQVAAVIIFAVAVAIIISSSCSCFVGCCGAFEHFLTCLNISQSMRNNKFCDICSFSLKIQNTQTKTAMQCEAKWSAPHTHNMAVKCCITLGIIYEIEKTNRCSHRLHCHWLVAVLVWRWYLFLESQNTSFNVSTPSHALFPTHFPYFFVWCINTLIRLG